MPLAPDPPPDHVPGYVPDGWSPDMAAALTSLVTDAYLHTNPYVMLPQSVTSTTADELVDVGVVERVVPDIVHLRRPALPLYARALSLQLRQPVDVFGYRMAYLDRFGVAHDDPDHPDVMDLVDAYPRWRSTCWTEEDKGTGRVRVMRMATTEPGVAVRPHERLTVQAAMAFGAGPWFMMHPDRRRPMYWRAPDQPGTDRPGTRVDPMANVSGMIADFRPTEPRPRTQFDPPAQEGTPS